MWRNMEFVNYAHSQNVEWILQPCWINKFPWFTLNENEYVANVNEYIYIYNISMYQSDVLIYYKSAQKTK